MMTYALLEGVRVLRTSFMFVFTNQQLFLITKRFGSYTTTFINTFYYLYYTGLRKTLRSMHDVSIELYFYSFIILRANILSFQKICRQTDGHTNILYPSVWQV